MSLQNRLLETLAALGKPVAIKDLLRRFGRNQDRKELKELLRRLIADGEVLKIRGGRIGLPSRMNLVVGRLSCHPQGFGFVVPEKDGGDDVYVSAANMKDALHSDRVVARIERRGPKGAEGRIIRILERGLARLVGRYEDDGRFGGHVVPFDKRVLHELFIPPGEHGGAEPSDMVVAEVTRPPTPTRNPAGRVLRVLGRLEEPGVDLKVVMAKYELPEAFSPEVEQEAKRLARPPGPDDLHGRTDFRSWPTVTIDPESARDHDDAVSLSRGQDGSWRLAVHIADVAHYVRPGALVDQEAYLRGTSVYFPDTVVPMLPHALSSDVCSLVEGQDRLTQSVVMELDAKGRLRRSEFHDGVIRSVARLSYPVVQKVVDGDAALRKRHSALVALLEGLDELAKLMRKRRHDRGSLDLDLPEPELQLGPSGEITGIVASERLDSMRMIEEFMLAANEAVAEELSKAGMPALYRIHERPDPERVEEFCELVASFGYRLPGNLEQVRPEDFQLVLKQIQGKPEERLVSYLLLRTMKLARYHEENLGHFGLATQMYAHFTSPIRRYPDLVVHRALRAMRSSADTEGQARLKEDLPEMGRHLSERERKADEAERELIEWKKIRFMADKVGDVYAGYVTGVQAFGLFVELVDVYVQGLVHVSTMSDDYYLFEERAHTLKGENTKRTYRLGDKVEVQVVRVDLERRQIDFALADVLQRTAGRKSTGRKSTGRKSTKPGRPQKPRRRRG